MPLAVPLVEDNLRQQAEDVSCFLHFLVRQRCIPQQLPGALEAHHTGQRGEEQSNDLLQRAEGFVANKQIEDIPDSGMRAGIGRLSVFSPLHSQCATI